MKQFVNKKLLLLFSGLVLLFVFTSTFSFAGDIDPSGAKTGTINDVPAAKPGEPTLAEVADAVGHSRIALNFSSRFSIVLIKSALLKGFTI